MFIWKLKLQFPSQIKIFKNNNNIDLFINLYYEHLIHFCKLNVNTVIYSENLVLLNMNIFWYSQFKPACWLLSNSNALV